MVGVWMHQLKAFGLEWEIVTLMDSFFILKESIDKEDIN
jgi:hypothetical protein